MANTKKKSKRAGSAGQRSDPRQSRLFVGSLDKGLQILRVFDRERRAMSLREIVDVSGLDRSSVQRFTHTLHTLGYLRKDESTRQYKLTPKVMELGVTYLQTDELLESATPILYEVNRKCDETANIIELLGTEVVYVARAVSRNLVNVDIFLGMRMPAYATASGRVFLAYLSEDEAIDIIKSSNPRKITRHTMTTLAEFRRELKRIRKKGYCIASEQCYLGEVSLAAPIFDSEGRCAAAMNVSVPMSRWTDERAEKELIPLLTDAARAISRGPSVGFPWFYQYKDQGPFA